MLQPTNAITLDNLIAQTDDTSPSCELVIHGKNTGQRLKGCILEAAIECDTGYFVFLTHDCPFEETLSIYLVNHSGTLQDSADLFGMYITGVFRNLHIHPPNQVTFEFFADAIWTVTLLPRLKRHSPLSFESMGVQRLFAFKRHFTMTRKTHWQKVGQCLFDWLRRLKK